MCWTFYSFYYKSSSSRIEIELKLENELYIYCEIDKFYQGIDNQHAK